ncbi:BREX-1 system adenine-specific DNA-methyltransferase PglX, partial [Alphaproteobacteria bacterium]|nr:BREX-1 system adenine-specific DNA-methyltransferase PglX [Alphaproteobacteria bacterium]
MDTNALKKFAQDARQTLKKTISIKLKFVLSNESLARRENQKAITDLENRIRRHSEEQVIEEVAYTWFNRLCALQYMDVNGYNSIRVISPSDNQTRPEILSDANAGVFDNKIISENTQQRVTALLDGRSASNDPDNEAYRLLLVSVCNYLHASMPFMFERIADYTELLLPDDMLSRTSILNDLKEVLTVDNCRDVEVIGWLYQFYISEKKDEIFAGLKKNQKVTPENIPAATQLFTPHWIVKYLVENSLGRLWMLNRPNSSLVNQMEYYIKPEEPEADFLRITSLEEIKVCDPACGSGHMLTYAFDLLYYIYQEEGYDEASIPTLILQNNLYGIELDKRAGDLAAFALTMKARNKQRSFLRNPIQPNICVLENVSFDTDELNEYINAVGRDLFTAPLRTTLKQFEEADNFGSL